MTYTLWGRKYNFAPSALETIIKFKWQQGLLYSCNFFYKLIRYFIFQGYIIFFANFWFNNFSLAINYKFKKKLRPPFFFNFSGGHISSTYYSCSFLRYWFLGQKEPLQNNNFSEYPFAVSMHKRLLLAQTYFMIWINQQELVSHWKNLKLTIFIWTFCLGHYQFPIINPKHLMNDERYQ